MNIKTEVIPVSEFEEVGEFEMPLEKDYIMIVDTTRENTILRDYALKHGYPVPSWIDKE